MTTTVSLIDETSVSRTIDAVAEAAFEDRSLSEAERLAVARWIAGRQGLPGAKSDSFAGFADEARAGFLAFTGERFTHASGRHILGEEACRALRLLDVDDPEVATALARADAGLLGSISRAEHDPRYRNPGVYCCGKCSVGMWRNLLAGGLDRQEERLGRGVDHLRAHRTRDGKWSVFPFWYTVLALFEIDLPVARDELRHAAPALERAVRRAPAPTTRASRRHELASRALTVL